MVAEPLNRFSRKWGWIKTGVLAFALIHSILTTVTIAVAQDECDYDASTPNLMSAREALNSLNYMCAERELKDMLGSGAITPQGRAEAHILLGTVYFLMMIGDEERQEDAVRSEFVEAFRAYYEWAGSLEYDIPRLNELLSEARQQVKQERAAALAAEQAVIDTAAATRTSDGKLWKRWWVWAAATAVTVGGVALLAGGGSGGGSDSPASAIPAYPEPPQ